MATEAFLQIVMEKVASLITQEIGLIVGAQTEMEKLVSNFTAIQAALEDAQLNHRENRQIQDWLKKLTDAAYEIDDILDECATHFSRSKTTLQPSCFCVRDISFRHNIGRKIKRATGRLDNIAAERERYSSLRSLVVQKSSKELGARETSSSLRSLVVQKSSKELGARETSSHLNEIDHIYGREDDKEKIVDILVNQAMSNQKISVQPIIGIGGLGKTTLAQLVLKDPRVVEHFGLRLWVCVSDNFDLKSLIKAIIESGSESTGKGSASDLTTLEALQSRLGSLLGQKKYLLVLDDVWNEDQQEWSKLRNALSCGSTGSSIIVTTRVPKVAEIMGTLPSYDLDELSEEHCWMLLKHHAFHGCDEEEQYPHLVPIGKQIVKKCKGVPLAAATLGGILQFKERTEKEWIGVKESELWDLKQGETDILPVLKLSYRNLPLELRQCFTYCAIFPKDFTISKQELVRLWVAHGYISSHGKLEAEDVGEQIMNELILRSLLQISKDNPKKLTMHDLHHDLAQSIMENSVVVPGTQLQRISVGASSSKIRRKIREVNLSKKYMAFPTSRQIKMDINSILEDYHCLRVLHTGFVASLPSAIDRLIHLRLLNLSSSNITCLPNTICSLWNLHELNLNYCSKLMDFPKNMRDLKNLRHLHIEGCWALVMTPFRVGELTFLRTLSKFIVNYEKGHRLEELENLNLGGVLEIRRADRVKSRGDAEKANLVEKCNLRYLSIYWDVGNGSQEKDEMVLDALKPHSDLECLCLDGFSGRHLASWMTRSSVPKLVKITLKDCPNLADLSHVEELTHLEYLRLVRVSIEYLGEGGNALNSSHFPALKQVHLEGLSNLKGFFKEEVMCHQKAFPKLQQLHVQKCPCLILPPLNTLEKLYIDDGNEQCIPPTDELRGLNSLRLLQISFNDTLRCLPPKSWLCHNNSTLQEIIISKCREFVDMPEEIKHLHSLKQIVLWDLPKMESIPDAIKHVHSLEALFLHSLPSLTSLPEWLGNLTSLRTLDIYHCEEVASLPEHGMKNLQSLTIEGCPKLKRRLCEEGKGEDWHKIAHIPKLYVWDSPR